MAGATDLTEDPPGIDAPDVDRVFVRLGGPARRPAAVTFQ